MIRWKASVGWPRMRNSNHETRFCDRVGGGLHRRIYSQLCPWRLRAQSYDTPRIASTADARFSKPDSGPARGTYAAARHQRAVGAEPIWRGHVARLASSVSSVTTALTAANAGASLLRRVGSAIPECRRAPKLQLQAQAGERREYIHFRHHSIHSSSHRELRKPS